MENYVWMHLLLKIKAIYFDVKTINTILDLVLVISRRFTSRLNDVVTIEEAADRRQCLYVRLFHFTISSTWKRYNNTKWLSTIFPADVYNKLYIDLSSWHFDTASNILFEGGFAFWADGSPASCITLAIEKTTYYIIALQLQNIIT